MRVLFIHGRAQGGKDPTELKQVWINTLNEGLAAAGLELPTDVKFDFPYYGDKLDAYTSAAALPTPEDITAKGTGQNREFEDFMQSVLGEMLERSELTDEEVEAELEPSDLREKGPQNWAWVQAIARAIDKHFTGVSESTINQFLRDVYLYVHSPGVANGINSVIEQMLTDEPTMVVGHSLGSVVGYRVIRDNRSRRHFCRYVTVGCPLGINAISSRLGIPENVAHNGWYNAYDEGDIVALNPLDHEYFPTEPPIVNDNGVNNHTANQHGIVGYLNDPGVARAIVDGLSDHVVR